MGKYIDLESGNEDTSFDFFLDCLLRARIETKHETDTDEDVNMYLADLMEKFIDPNYLQHIENYLSKYDTDIAKMVGEHDDNVYSYLAYKNNADFYTMSFGLFEGLKMPNVPESLKIPPKNFIDRAEAYYGFAANFSSKVFKGKDSIEKVLGRLSEHLWTYLEILNYMKEKYLNIREKFKFSAGEWFHLIKEANVEADKALYKNKIDLFLRLYCAYRKNKRVKDKKRLIELSNELGDYDPGFQFNLA